MRVLAQLSRFSSGAVMHRTFYSLGWCFICTVLLLCCVGCLSAVRLPSAPNYPTHKIPVSNSKEHHLVLSHIQSKQKQLWKHIQLSWGIREPYGRLWLRLTFQDRRLLACSIVRSNIRASLVKKSEARQHAKHIHTLFLREYKAMPQEYGVCVFLQKQYWNVSKAQRFQVHYILKRTQLEAGE